MGNQTIDCAGCGGTHLYSDDACPHCGFSGELTRRWEVAQ